MNREIKYNVWDIERQNYFRDVLSLENDKITKWATLEIRTSDNVKWLQFTGLKDKNDIEIYEGDILMLPSKYKGIVEWYHCGFILRLENEVIWQNLLFNVNKHYTIVGNIYQNPIKKQDYSNVPK